MIAVANPTPRRRVYILSAEMVQRIRERQVEGGHASEVDTVRYLLANALARHEERRARVERSAP